MILVTPSLIFPILHFEASVFPCYSKRSVLSPMEKYCLQWVPDPISGHAFTDSIP